MDISTATLDQLDTPNRIFRPHSNDSPSCQRPKTSCPYFTNNLLRKREVLDEEEAPFYNLNEYPEFFVDAQQTGPTGPRSPGVEAKSSNAHKRVQSPPIKNNNISFSPSKTIPLDLSLKRQNINKTKVSPQKDETRETDFLSEDEGFKKAINEARSSDLVSGDVSYVESESKINSDCNLPKYQRRVRGRAQNTDPAYLRLRKKKAVAAMERYHLKTRAMRISLFWQGKKNFLPSAFRLVCFSNDSTKTLIEHQDFSHKGVNHIDEAFDAKSLVSKFSNVLESFAQKSIDDSQNA